MSITKYDCVLFIDELMAKVLIAVRSSESQDPDTISKIVGISKGQASDKLKQAIAIGAVDERNILSDIAEKCVASIIKNALKN